jgi:predicted MFS family arabinose efflux permease
VGGLALLSVVQTRVGMITAAVVFAVGFGSAYPSYVAHVLQHVHAARRGAAFGSVLAAFDIGIGTGSLCAGWIVQRAGYPTAFATAAALATLSLPYFLLVEPRIMRAAD